MSLNNVMVRFSSDSVRGEYVKGLHGSVIVPTTENVPSDVSLCGAYSRDGKCGGCRTCWDRSVAVIAYPAHGKKMQKVINIKVAA